MSTQEAPPTAAIPQRDDIAEHHKWNLSDIFPTEQDWEKAFNQAKKITEEAGQYQGKLSESADTLFKCLQARTELAKVMHNLGQYSYLARDIDNRVSKYQAMTERMSVLSSMAMAAFAYVEPELLKIEEKKLLELAGKFEQPELYDFYIKELIRSKEHIRSQEVEQVLAMSSTIGRAPGNIFSMLDNADMTYPSIKDENGNEVPLTKQRYAKFLDSADRRVREDANDAMMGAYKKQVNTISSILSAGVNSNIFYARARNYESALHAALDSNNIPVSVYHSLLDTVEADLAGLHKYVELRKKILKLDDIKPFDMMCPLFPDKDYEVKYDEAVRQVLEAVAPLGDKYQKDLKTAFDSRWVDVYETEGKGSGAYNSGNYNVHPFVLMNYNDTVDNMFTLAHEMGHAMHSHLTAQTQPFTKAQYSIFVAEVASTLNEGLLLHFLKDKATDKFEQLYLINRYLDNTVGTFFHQVLYARFELAIHRMVEAGEAFSPDILTGIWGELTQKYYGPTLIVDDFTPFKWARIPHFYMDYYVYQYATSYAASQAILDKFLKGEEGVIDSYLRMLSSGGCDYPIELLKICDVDMTTPAPVNATLAMFAAQVDEMEKLALS